MEGVTMLSPKEFFIALLGIPDYVRISVVKTKFSKNSKFMVGYCYNDLDDSFKIVINQDIVDDPDPTYWIETLAHEMVHVWQYATKKLVDGGGAISYWQGVAIDEAKTPYAELPWEIEAYQKQIELTLDYLAYMGRHH